MARREWRKEGIDSGGVATKRDRRTDGQPEGRKNARMDWARTTNENRNSGVERTDGCAREVTVPTKGGGGRSRGGIKAQIPGGTCRKGRVEGYVLRKTRTSGSESVKSRVHGLVCCWGVQGGSNCQYLP